MFKAIKEIGELFENKEENLYTDLEGEGVEHVFIWWFDKDGNYLGVEYEEFDLKKQNKYLFYKSTNNKMPVWTPMYRPQEITEIKKNINKVIQEHILNTIKDLSYLTTPDNIQIIRPKISDFASQMQNDFLAHPKLIQLNKEKNKEKQKKKNIMVGIGVKIGEDKLYPGDFQEIKRELKKYLSNKYKLHDQQVMCSICHKLTSSIYAPTFPEGFKWFTTDKENYISGGMKEEVIYRNFPVCKECFQFIENGAKQVRLRLKFTFDRAENISYYLIPHFLTTQQDDDKEYILKQIMGISESSTALQDRQNVKNLLSDSDDEIVLDLLKDMNDMLMVHFLFVVISKSQTAVKLHVPDIYPSRLHKLFEFKNVVDTAFTYTKRYKDKETKQEVVESRQFNFTYHKLYNFTKHKINTDTITFDEKPFYGMLYNTFKQLPVDNDMLISYFMRKIRIVATHPSDSFMSDVKNTILDAHACYLFVLLSSGKEVKMEAKRIENYSSLQEFADSLGFDTDLKKGLFFLGAVVGRVLYAQQDENGSMPFMKKLKGFKMNEKDIRGLMGEAINKLTEYDRLDGYERELISLASGYLARVPEPWNISIDELNFYVALGVGHTFVYGTPLNSLYFNLQESKRQRQNTEQQKTGQEAVK